MSNAPIKNRYKIKKQWQSILPDLSVPAEIPFDFTKNFKILLMNGDEKLIKDKKDFDAYIGKLIEDGKEIENVMFDLNFEKLIIKVEKTFSALVKK
jgi:hypothetical protein